VQAWLILLAWPVAAQLRFDGLSTDLNGTVAVGYTADYGNMISSDHSWTLSGTGNLSGSYYSPNFLTFNVTGYLNQSRANSNFQSISDASGVDASSNLFSGSHFPGSVSYSKSYNSEGNYAVPGLANYVTHGNSDTVAINWSENLPDAPSFSAGYQRGSGDYSVYGTNDDGQNTFHSVNLHSSYQVVGISMGAFYTNGGSHSLIPEVVTGTEATETTSSNHAFGFNAACRLPLRGTASSGVNRSSWDTNYMGATSSGTVDTVNALVDVNPTTKLSLSESILYSDNLTGQLIQAVIAAGGSVAGTNSNQSSDSLDLLSLASYNPMTSMQSYAFFERRTQSYLGENYGVKSYGGGATYAHKILDGNFNAGLTLTKNSTDQTGEDTLGFSTTENYSSEIRGWHFTGTFGYAQNVQTLLVTYMNSFYHYSGNARRRWGRFNFSAGAGGSRTGLTEQAGTNNNSHSYNASAGYGIWVVASGNYSKASGQALATGSGLVPVPIPSPVLPSSLVSLFGGDSYSFALSSTPVRNLILSGSWAKSISNTTSNGAASSNENDEYNALVEYHVRKLTVNSGYSRLRQGFSGSGTAPEVISSFYIGVSRWFSFF
jgi:hypothetical protein